MSYRIGALQTILPVMIVLVIGICLRKKNAVSREGIDTLKKVAVDIALPAVLINAFATTQYSLRNILLPVMMFLICILACALGALVTKGLRMNDRFLPFITTGFEAGMLGYTLFTMLYGEEQLASFAIIDLGQVLFVFTVYKMLLNAHMNAGKTGDASAKQNGKMILKSMITSPIIIAIVCGVLIGATGLYGAMQQAGISPVFDKVVEFVSAPTSVLILLSIGYDLVFDKIPLKKVLTAVGIRFVIMMLALGCVILVLKQFFAGDAGLIRAAIVMFILPPPYVLPIFADDESQYTYISSVLTVSTLLSIICFGVLAYLPGI